jgi:arylamine N-acetyltransferase
VSELVDAYLARLRVEAEPPSADALARLHRAHVERVPYETVWIHMGERWGVSPADSVERVALGGRGGYCFHLNGAFSELLGALGYDVVRHVGGVHGPGGPAEGDLTNHLVLTVHGLPSPSNPGGDWYVDAGLGDALHDPLPMVAGVYPAPPWTLQLAPTPGGVGDWHLQHDPAGGFTGMAWRSAAASMSAFEARNEWLSSAPESGFVQVMTAQRRDATGVDVVRGRVLRRIGAGASDAVLETQADLVSVLADVFSIDVGARGRDAVEALWARVSEAHARWVAGGGSGAP